MMEEEPIRVLLIESNWADARLLRKALAIAGRDRFHVEQSNRLSRGLEGLAQGGIDVVLLDLSLPDSQGLETFLRARSHAPETPIVVLACLDDEPLAVQAVQEGAQDYLVKGQAESPVLVRSLGYAVERHRAAGLLRVHQRQIGFISAASHELRTTMTTILGFTKLLQEQDPPESSRREWLERIHRDCWRLATIVDDLLDVSRIQSGSLTLQPELLVLRDIVQEVLADITPTTDRHEFLVEIAPHTLRVFADRDKLAQVLVNLLGNAVKYSPSGGPITISARPVPQMQRVAVAVADQGIGIAPEDRGALFSWFHRIRRPETEGVQGTGLGLYIVKALVELMSGEVWMEGELNRGSTFLFSLPVCA